MTRQQLLFTILILCIGCTQDKIQPADIVISNAHVYTFSWDDPSVEGLPAPNAPVKDGEWHADAEAIAISNGLIVFVGSNKDVEKHIGKETELIDAKGAFVLPGLIESHGHLSELGERREEVNLVGLTTEQIIEVVYQRSLELPKGEWIIASGWDEGEFANQYPDMKLLSAKVPDHPVVLIGLRGFGTMGNDLAFERAGITKETESTFWRKNFVKRKG